MKSPEAAQPPSESVSSEFRPYLTSTGLAGIAIAMQQLLLAWILIGILELPASEVGLVQAVVGIPGIILILLGGAKADGMDPRALLIKVYACAPVLPLFLVAMLIFSQIALWNILLWGLGMSFVISYTSPAQQALLNRVARGEVQKVRLSRLCDRIYCADHGAGCGRHAGNARADSGAADSADLLCSGIADGRANQSEQAKDSCQRIYAAPAQEGPGGDCGEPGHRADTFHKFHFQYFQRRIFHDGISVYCSQNL